MIVVAPSTDGNVAKEVAPAPDTTTTTSTTTSSERRSFLRGGGGDRLSRDDRSIDKKIKNPLNHEHFDIFDDLSMAEKYDDTSSGVDVGAVRQNRTYDPFKSTNHKLMTTNTLVRHPPLEADPSFPSSSISKPSVSDSLTSLSNYEHQYFNNSDDDNNYVGISNNNNNNVHTTYAYTYKNINSSSSNSSCNSSSSSSSSNIINHNVINTNNQIIMGVLISLIVILASIMFFLVYKPLCRYFKRKFCILFSVNKKLIERRYSTIDKWLIRKVS